MSNEESSNTSGLTFDKALYQREYMRRKRNREKEEAHQQAKANLSTSDQLFEDDKPGYYIFDQKEREANCWNCGKSFRTRMLLKFCSPDCKINYLRVSLNAKERE